MLPFLLLCLCFTANSFILPNSHLPTASLQASAVPAYDEFFFDQVLDHFNFNSFPGNVTFRQRYLVAKTSSRNQNGPIFFYTGNEGPITTFYNNTGFMFDIAPEFGATVIFAEHRFYGTSLPASPEKSFQQPYIGLLTIEQALADFATLIDFLKMDDNMQDSPVIVFGGSYGGILSAYMRLKYPNLVDGALAASAPVLGIADITDNRTFFEDVTKIFSQTVDGCESQIRDAFDAMDTLSQQGDDGYKQLTTTFKLCQPLTPNHTGDYKQLQGWVRNIFALMAMLNYPYPANFLAPLPAWPVKYACSLITQSKTGALDGLAQAAFLFYGQEQQCYDMWSEFVDCADPTSCGTGPDATAWDYQACTEMTLSGGTYGGDEDMFPYLPWTSDMRLEYCNRHYNVTPRDSVLRIEYWGEHLQSTSNIIFSNGMLDPWHRGGILKNVTLSVVAILIEDGAHHLDLRGSDPADPKSVVDARKMEVALLRQFVDGKKQRRPL